MQIFTNAPRALDYGSAAQDGEFGILRIVSVKGSDRLAALQLVRYKKNGFFATTHRADAMAYLTQNETIEGLSDRVTRERWPESGSIDMDRTLPME